MLRIRPVANAVAAKEYHKKHLVVGDYHMQQDGKESPEEQAGVWGGRLASSFGLKGKVQQDDFFDLIDNRYPKTIEDVFGGLAGSRPGEQITLRHDEDRRPGFDFTFNWPKSVSEQYALTGDERILEIARRAAWETMKEDIEPDMCVRLRGAQIAHAMKDGLPLIQTVRGAWSTPVGNMMAAEFFHTTARPLYDPENGKTYPDMHGHFHFFVPNIGWNPHYVNKDGRKGAYMALDIGHAKKRGRLHEAAFHSRMAHELAKIGYAIETQGNGYFELAGYGRDLVEKFSRRQDQVIQRARALGISDPAALAEIAAKTRGSKDTDYSWAEINAIWHGKITEDEWRVMDNLLSQADGTARFGRVTAREAVTWSIDHSLANKSVARLDDIREWGYRRGFGSVSKAEVDAVVDSMIADGDLFGDEVDGYDMVSTKAVELQEAYLLRFAQEGRNQSVAVGNADYEWQTDLFRGFQDSSGKWIEAAGEQKAAVLHLLTTNDRVTVIRGAAGAGKTSMMQEAAKAVESFGRKMHAFAPSARAGRGVLREEGFAEANTVAKLLKDLEIQEGISRGDVLLIDEAGMIGTETMARIFRIAEERGCKLVLSGDTRQHGAVERGNALKLLEDRHAVSVVELEEIRRQLANPEYLHVVEMIAAGRLIQAFDALDDMGAIVDVSDLSAKRYFEKVAKDYVRAISEKNVDGENKSVLVVSPTHREKDLVSGAIRDRLREVGQLGDRERIFTTLRPLHRDHAEKRVASTYRHELEGDALVVQFHQNVGVPGLPARGKGKPFFNAGGQFDVVEARGDTVLVRDREGQVAKLPLNAAEHFALYQKQQTAVAVGDKLKITKGSLVETVAPPKKKGGKPRRRSLDNGDIVEVRSVTQKGEIILGNGCKLGPDFQNFEHGYVSTSHASQGDTVDEVLIAQSARSFAASNMRQFYVSVSRGKENVRIYTDDKEELRARVASVTPQMSAMDLRDRQRKTAMREELAGRMREAARQVTRVRQGLAPDNGRAMDGLMLAHQRAAGAEKQRGIVMDE